jgi:beta-glucanase (GH16 family)
VDFTQIDKNPANWTLTEYENVSYGTLGVEFTFAERLDAPSVSTDFYILFGRVEVVMQAAPGVGIISSATLVSDDQDEIDWEFSGNDFNMRSGNVQTNYFGKGIVGNYDRGTYPSVSSPQTQFHNYVLDWSTEELIWSIDGVVVRTLVNNNATSGPYQYPQSPMRVELGLWDGGDAGNSGDTIEWAGGRTNLNKAPFTMYVKSVTIMNANPCTGGYLYTDMTGSYQSIECVSTGT